jgi:hypothetical protein
MIDEGNGENDQKDVDVLTLNLVSQIKETA